MFKNTKLNNKQKYALLIVITTILIVPLLYLYNNREHFLECVMYAFKIQGVLTVVSIIFSLPVYYMMKVIEGERTYSYLKRLRIIHTFIYIVFLSIFLYFYLYRLHNQQKQDNIDKASNISITNEAGIDLNVLLDINKRDSVVKAISTNKKYNHVVRQSIDNLNKSYKRLVDTLNSYYNENKIEDNIIITYFRLTGNEFTKVAYNYHYKNNLLSYHIVFYIVDSNNTTVYLHNVCEIIPQPFIDSINNRINIKTPPKLIDTNILFEIKKSYDSLHAHFPKRDDFWKIEDYYVFNGDLQNRILYDSLNNIVGIRRQAHGKPYYVLEYFDNGQQKCSSSIPFNGLNDTLTLEYYHRNGTIKSTGKYFNFSENGIWIYFDSTGKIERVYDHR